jgi:endonuclease V-like protein UPF0215 family
MLYVQQTLQLAHATSHTELLKKKKGLSLVTVTPSQAARANKHTTVADKFSQPEQLRVAH